jgi:hypothetical protein
LSKRSEQQEELQKKIAEAGEVYNMQYLAACYGVSFEAVKLYKERNKRYPLLYYAKVDTEHGIVDELNMIDRLLKINKLKIKKYEKDV